MKIRSVVILWGLWVACAPVGVGLAAELVVTVADPEGVPLPWAVVSVSPTAGQGNGSWQPGPAVMRQQGTLFEPFVVSVQRGATVSFPNLDDVRHHVYSFSRAKSFELRLYGQDETKTVVFDETGAIALGCNIHDNMLSYVYVTDAPVHAVTDSSGLARFTGLPGDTWNVQVWHPDLAGDAPDPQPVTLQNPSATAVEIRTDLRAVRRRQLPPSTGRYR